MRRGERRAPLPSACSRREGQRANERGIEREENGENDRVNEVKRERELWELSLAAVSLAPALLYPFPSPLSPYPRFVPSLFALESA